MSGADFMDKRTAAPAAPVNLAGHAGELSALFVFTERLHRARSPGELYDAALDAITDTLHCDRSSILLFDNDGAMRFVAWRNLSERYRNSVEGHSPWARNEREPRPICIGDMRKSTEPEALKSIVAAEGIGAISFIPLVTDRELIGKFMTYYDKPHRFTAEETELAVMLARQLAIAVSRLRAEDARRSTEAALNRERELLRTIMDRIPVMITLYEPNTRVLGFNPEFERVTGWTADEATGLSLMEKAYPDPAYREKVTAFMQRCDGSWMDVSMRTRDGREIETAWANLRLSQGMQVGIGIDIGERKKAEGAREHLAAIVESSSDAIVGKDLNGIIKSWNKGAEQLFGYTAEEIIGKPVTVIIPEDRQHEEPEILRRIRAGERLDHFETIRRRKDGSLLHISLTVSPVKNASGKVVGASKIARDITEQKQAEAQRDLLVAELSHRVKNTLATVISIARQSFANPDSEEARGSFDSRIRGLAQTHSRLAESNWSGVSLATMLADELAPYRNDSNVHIEGPAIELNPKCALTLGLAVHELATNAAKYGALSSKSGEVHVTWAYDASEHMLRLAWTERGGPPVNPPKRSGFGRLLIERALASDLNGAVELEFANQGLRCTIAIPENQFCVRQV